jgi:hypothetical protein
MAGTAAQIAEDNAAVEDYRTKFGDTEDAKFAADLYKLRRTPDTGLAARFPRGIVILIAIWVGLLETADKLPLLLLSIPKYEATVAEYQAKLLQPELTQAQLDKARLEAKAAEWQPFATAAQGLEAEARIESNVSLAARFSEDKTRMLVKLRPLE